MLECKGAREEEKGTKEHTTEQTNIITLHYCIQYGSRKQKNPKKNLDMYNPLQRSLSATIKTDFLFPSPLKKQPLYGLLSVQCHTFIVLF